MTSPPQSTASPFPDGFLPEGETQYSRATWSEGGSVLINFIAPLCTNERTFRGDMDRRVFVAHLVSDRFCAELAQGLALEDLFVSADPYVKTEKEARHAERLLAFLGHLASTTKDGCLPEPVADWLKETCIGHLVGAFASAAKGARLATSAASVQDDPGESSRLSSGAPVQSEPAHTAAELTAEARPPTSDVIPPSPSDFTASGRHLIDVAVSSSTPERLGDPEAGERDSIRGRLPHSPGRPALPGHSGERDETATNTPAAHDAVHEHAITHHHAETGPATTVLQPVPMRHQESWRHLLAVPDTVPVVGEGYGTGLASIPLAPGAVGLLPVEADSKAGVVPPGLTGEEPRTPVTRLYHADLGKEGVSYPLEGDGARMSHAEEPFAFQEYEADWISRLEFDGPLPDFDPLADLEFDGNLPDFVPPVAEPPSGPVLPFAPTKYDFTAAASDIAHLSPSVSALATVAGSSSSASVPHPRWDLGGLWPPAGSAFGSYPTGISGRRGAISELVLPSGDDHTEYAGFDYSDPGPSFLAGKVGEYEGLEAANAFAGSSVVPDYPFHEEETIPGNPDVLHPIAWDVEPDLWGYDDSDFAVPYPPVASDSDGAAEATALPGPSAPSVMPAVHGLNKRDADAAFSPMEEAANLTHSIGRQNKRSKLDPVNPAPI